MRKLVKRRLRKCRRDIRTGKQKQLDERERMNKVLDQFDYQYELIKRKIVEKQVTNLATARAEIEYMTDVYVDENKALKAKLEASKIENENMKEKLDEKEGKLISLEFEKKKCIEDAVNKSERIIMQLKQSNQRKLEALKAITVEMEKQREYITKTETETELQKEQNESLEKSIADKKKEMESLELSHAKLNALSAKYRNTLKEQKDELKQKEEELTKKGEEKRLALEKADKAREKEVKMVGDLQNKLKQQHIDKEARHLKAQQLHERQKAIIQKQQQEQHKKELEQRKRDQFLREKEQRLRKQEQQQHRTREELQHKQFRQEIQQQKMKKEMRQIQNQQKLTFNLKPQGQQDAEQQSYVPPPPHPPPSFLLGQLQQRRESLSRQKEYLNGQPSPVHQLAKNIDQKQDEGKEPLGILEGNAKQIAVTDAAETQLPDCSPKRLAALAKEGARKSLVQNKTLFSDVAIDVTKRHVQGTTVQQFVQNVVSPINQNPIASKHQAQGTSACNSRDNKDIMKHAIIPRRIHSATNLTFAKERALTLEQSHVHNEIGYNFQDVNHKMESLETTHVQQCTLKLDEITQELCKWEDELSVESIDDEILKARLIVMRKQLAILGEHIKNSRYDLGRLESKLATQQEIIESYCNQMKSEQIEDEKRGLWKCLKYVKDAFLSR